MPGATPSRVSSQPRCLGAVRRAAGRVGTGRGVIPLGGFLENAHVSLCREVHMKDRGRAMGVIARSRLTRGDDQTLPTCTGAPQALTAIH